MNEIIFRFLNNLAGKSEVFDSLVLFGAEYLWIFMVVWVFVTLSIFYYFEEIKKPIKESSQKKWLVIGRHAILAVITGFIAWGISQIIKYYYISPRPFLILPDINLLFLHGYEDSFPSGHTTFTFAFATIFYIYHKKRGIIYLTIAFLVGLSRVIAGVHWPYDIFGGIALGVVVAFVSYYLFERYKKYRATSI